MPRGLVLANGRLHLAWDHAGRLREATWPGVGDPNHLFGRTCHVGVSTPRRFAWLGQGWRGSVGYAPGLAATRSVFEHPKLKVRLEIHDHLHPTQDLLLRKFRLANLEPRERRLGLFLAHPFQIDGSDIGDTALVDPKSNGILHYKRDRWLLANIDGANHHACGVIGFHGHEGTWRDAEDGALSGNPGAHGSVDSAIGITRDVGPLSTATIRAWLAFGPDLPTVRRLDALAREKPAPAPELPAAPKLPSDLRELWRRSVHVVRAACDHRGGILAAIDSDILAFNRDTYGYVWPRDGAFVARSLDLAGQHDVARRYFDFVARLPRIEAVDDAWNGALLHKYTIDGGIASTWHWWKAPPGGVKPPAPIQEDETALTLWALAEHQRLARADVTDLAKQMVPLAEFLVAYRDETGLPLPSYDPWEERWGVLFYTCATVVAGLRAATRLTGRTRYAKVAEEVAQRALEELWIDDRGHFARMRSPDGSLDPTPEASMLVAPLLGLLPWDDERFVATARHVLKGTKVAGKVGGYARYDGDYYHRQVEDAPGNPWIVTTMWAAYAREESLNKDGAVLQALHWAKDRAGPSLHLAEQFHPRSGAPLSIDPLTWSHAAFLEGCARLTSPRAAKVPVPIATRGS